MKDYKKLDIINLFYNKLLHLMYFQTMETSVPGVFSAGDIVRGASLVVWAIRDGREAALSINKYLELKRQNKIVAA